MILMLVICIYTYHLLEFLKIYIKFSYAIKIMGFIEKIHEASQALLLY